jgi:predicted transcriptional regulator
LKACDSVIYHYWYGVKKTIADEFLLKNLNALISLQKNQKMEQVKQWARLLPRYFEQHLLTHKDNAIQAFNTNDYKRAYSASFKALLKGGLMDMTFLKDILYHTKRKITQTS